MSKVPLPHQILGKIHHGDCIAGMNDLPAESIDLVFADPPFNIGFAYDVYHDAKDYDQYLSWSRDWIGAVHRVLKPDGTFWLAIGDEYAAELKMESQKLGFRIRSWVIWYYTFGVNCKAKFSRSHAHLFHFVKDPKRFTFRAGNLENRIPSARLLIYGDSRGNPSGRLPDDTWILRPQDLAGHFTPDEDTWYFPRVAGTFKERAGFHGCQMPEQLLGRVLRACSVETDVVLDPFSGSATTLAVAKKLTRQYIGFDVSRDYVTRGNHRLTAIRAGDALEGAPEPTMSAPMSVKSRAEQTPSERSPLEDILCASAQGQADRSRAAFLRGLVEAFLRIHQGFSLDRVIADPELNAALARECETMGLPGDVRWWNRNLFLARKAGKLAAIPTGRRTELSWEQCDSFLFASEIAWKKLFDRGLQSLDEILCNPDTAAEFDREAAALAPGFSSLEYRWGALKLRKESKRAQDEARILSTQRYREPFLAALRITARDLTKIPDTAGIYLVSGDGSDDQSDFVYAGESLNLRARLQMHFDGAPRAIWKSWSKNLKVRYYTAAPHARILLACQFLCVRKHAPRFNLLRAA